MLNKRNNRTKGTYNNFSNLRSKEFLTNSFEGRVLGIIYDVVLSVPSGWS